jgi:Flp pilus assembly protein CpaB
MTYRIRNIVIAVALALVAALLTTFYVTNYKRTVEKSNDTVTVLVAARDIPKGTPGDEVVSGGFLTKQEIARKAVVPGAITAPGQVMNLVANETLLTGEQVTTRRFGSLEAKGPSGQFKGVVRAYQIPGDGNQLLVGTLKPGDRVDIVAGFEVKSVEGEEDFIARTILRGIEVLNVSGPAGLAETAEASSSARGDGAEWVQLALTDAQASKLLVAKAKGEWTLDLRPAVKDADSPENLENIGSVLRDGMPVRQLERAGMGG